MIITILQRKMPLFPVKEVLTPEPEMFASVRQKL